MIKYSFYRTGLFLDEKIRNFPRYITAISSKKAQSGTYSCCLQRTKTMVCKQNQIIIVWIYWRFEVTLKVASSMTEGHELIAEASALWTEILGLLNPIMFSAGTIKIEKEEELRGHTGEK